MFRTCIYNFASVSMADAVDNLNLIAGVHTEHADAMTGLRFGEFERLLDIGCVETYHNVMSINFVAQ